MVEAAINTETTVRLKILSRLYECGKRLNLNWFATGILAVYAQEKREIDSRLEQAVWEIAVLREDYNKLQKLCLKEGLRITETLDFHIQIALEGTRNANAHLCVTVYDRVPADPAERQDFLSKMQIYNRALQEALDSGSEKGTSLCRGLSQKAQEYLNDPSACWAAPLMGNVGPAVNLAVLLPTKNRKLGNALLQVPADCSMWTAKGSQALAREKLDILRVFDAFCQEQNIPYFAISKLEMSCRLYGDLLPDYGKSAMEVGMIRSDFDRFVRKATLDSRLTLFALNKAGKADGAMRVAAGNAPETARTSGRVISVLPYDILPDNPRENQRFCSEISDANAEFERIFESGDSSAIAAANNNLIAQVTKYSAQPITPNTRIRRIQGAKGKPLTYSEVYPTVRCPIADFAVSCPASPFIWARDDDPNYNEAANARKAEILRRLQMLCNQHRISAFAIADLLIGTVTYQDYVPNNPLKNWDLAALRKDYEKLLKVLRGEAGEYGLTLHELRSGLEHCPKMTVTVDLAEGGGIAGEIRLIPFDKVPEAYDTRYAFLRKLRRLNTCYRELSDEIVLGKSNLSQKEVQKLKKRYGAQPLPALYAEINRLAQTYNNDADTHLYGRVAMEKSKFIQEDALLPLVEAPFRDFTILRPNDYSVWTPVIDEALHNQVAQIQKADLLLIDKVDEICQKLNIGYFICGGSMLGYMRHGGFIPWDDDIDVAMLRSDYDRFMQEAGAFLDDRFFLQTRHSDPHIPYLFSKLRLNNTEYITEYNERRDFHKGICLDIFPFDYIPNGEKEQEAFKAEVLALSAAHNRVVNNQMPEPIDPVRPRNLREWYYRFYGKLKRFFFKCQSLKKTQIAYLDKATMYNAKAKELGLTTVASFVPSYTYIKLDDLLPYQRVTFEGHPVQVPRCPDVFLTMQYGDYLQLPPKHNQVAHKLLRWSVDLKADEVKRSGAV